MSVIFGIENLGNTCFLSSILQALFSQENLINFLKQDHIKELLSENLDLHRTSVKFTKTFINTIKVVNKSKEKLIQEYITEHNLQDFDFEETFGVDFLCINPKAIYKYIVPLARSRNIILGHQNDADETLSVILDLLFEATNTKIPQELTKIKNTTAIKRKETESFISEFKNDFSIILNKILGRTIIKMSCPTCNTKKYSFDSWTRLHLSLPELDINEKRINLIDLIEKQFKMEQLDSNNKLECEKCKKNVKMLKQPSICLLPETLIIHLKRFTAFSKKINTKIKFPINTLYITEPVSDETESSTYYLTAFVCHHGSRDFGHYTTTARYNDNWYLFDDDNVESVSPYDFKYLRDRVYMLFYTKK